MSQGHDIRIQAIADPAEERVTGVAASVLDRAPLARRPRVDVFTLDLERITESVRRRPGEVLVALGIVAELMIEVSDAGNRQFAGLVQRVQQVKERDRIAATRQGDDNARLASRQLVTPDCAPDGL
jgi:hypothetical protein